jgi:hypothetical protein
MFSQGEECLLGWFIEHRAHKTSIDKSINQVAEELSIDRKKVTNFLPKPATPKHLLPYARLIKIKDNYKKRKRKKE